MCTCPPTHARAHTHTHVCARACAKMAGKDKQRVDDALETLLSITEKSGNLRKDLKNEIHESVRTLRKAFILIYKQLDEVKEKYNSYREKVNNTMKGEELGEITQTDGQVATSVDYTLRPQENSTQQIVPPIGGRRKLFSEVVKYQDNNKR